MLKNKKEREREKNKMDERLKNQRSELEKGSVRGTVAHRHAIMRLLGLIYTRVRRRHHGKSMARPKEEESLGGIIQTEESHPNWKPATVSTGCTDARIRVFRRGITGNQKRELFRELK